MKPSRVAPLAFVLTVGACAPDGPAGQRPDAPPEADAATYTDVGLDARTSPDDAGFDAPATTEDAPTSDDAFVTSDTPAPVDAPLARDAAMPIDAATPRDVGPVWAIGFCRVQFPATIMTSAGSATLVYGRVYAAGLTTRSGMTDTDPLLVAEVGVGPDGSHPSMPSWSWTRGVSNVGYGPGSAGYEANNDEYQASLTAPSVGSYDFAFRVSGDGGLSWTYCDTLDPGSSDGYQLANAGQLVVM